MLVQLVSLSLLVRAISAYISRSVHLNRKRCILVRVRLFFCGMTLQLLTTYMLNHAIVIRCSPFSLAIDLLLFKTCLD